jgi:hypothetical protein
VIGYYIQEPDTGPSLSYLAEYPAALEISLPEISLPLKI